jgi:1-acyl-sn-glycerol-3-phosphate acyltransferase
VLPRWADFIWRLAGTGFAFAAFSVGGFVLAVVGFRLIDLATPDRLRRRERYQSLVRGAFRLFLWCLRGLRILDFNAVGVDDLKNARGVMLVANHPTLLDVVFLMALTPRAQCIVKGELFSNPFLGPVVSGAGYIRNDLEAEELVAACKAALAEGRNLVVFPEGTRTRPRERVRFRRGFAHIATLLRADIRYVLITCVPATLAKGDPWWAIPQRRPLFEISSGGLLQGKVGDMHQHRSIAARSLVRSLEGYYNERLADG